MSAIQPWWWSLAAAMNGPGGRSTTNGPSARSSTPPAYGVSEFAVKQRRLGRAAARRSPRLSSMPSSRLPLNTPSTETVGYQK
jgi:hypothetical protein